MNNNNYAQFHSIRSQKSLKTNNNYNIAQPSNIPSQTIISDNNNYNYTYNYTANSNLLSFTRLSGFSHSSKYQVQGKHDDIDPLKRKDTFEFTNDKEFFKLSQHQSCSCVNVLLCDDEEFNLSTIRMCFKRQNILTDKSTNGKECIDQIKYKLKHPCEICKSNEYKILLLDIMMPVMDGVETSKQIQSMMDSGEISKELQVIIISAHIDEELKERLKDTSCIKEYMVKPVKNDKIKQIIQKYCFAGLPPQGDFNPNLTLKG
jgi:CheY-like chemotaxis protein